MPAMGATFGGDLIMTSDISHQDGLQLEWTSGDLTFMVKYAKAIKLEPKHVFVTIYDADGDITSIPPIVTTGTAADEVVFAPAIAARDFTFTVEAALVSATTASKVEVKIAKDIASC